MKIGCKRCDTYEEHTPCPDCGNTQHIGDDYRCPHEPAFRSKGFEAYFDVSLGEYITTPGDIKKHCRPQWNNDYLTHLQEKR